MYEVPVDTGSKRGIIEPYQKGGKNVCICTMYIAGGDLVEDICDECHKRMDEETNDKIPYTSRTT